MTILKSGTVITTPEASRVRKKYADQADDPLMAIKEILDNMVLAGAKKVFIDSNSKQGLGEDPPRDVFRSARCVPRTPRPYPWPGIRPWGVSKHGGASFENVSCLSSSIPSISICPLAGSQAGGTVKTRVRENCSPVSKSQDKSQATRVDLSCMRRILAFCDSRAHGSRYSPQFVGVKCMVGWILSPSRAACKNTVSTVQYSTDNEQEGKV